MPTEIHHDKYKLSRTQGCISERGSGEHKWLEGIIYTKNGIVFAYSQKGENAFSRLSLVHDGFQHHFRIDRAKTPRGLAAWAAKILKQFNS